MPAYAQIAEHCPDSDLPLIRELAAFDALCPVSCQFARGELGDLLLKNAPSPLHWSRQTEWPWTLNRADFQPRDFVLDIGSGWSVLKYAVARRCPHGIVAALEVDPEFVERTQPSIDLLRERFTGLGVIRQYVGDVRRMRLFRDECFDKVLAVSVLEHMQGGYVEAVREMKRVLKPGGKMIVTMDVRINGDVPRDRDPDFFLTMRDAESLLRDELDVKQIVKSQKGDDMIGARLYNDRKDGERPVEIVVVMVCWEKAR